ncbi:hypothetical protein QTP88_002642 [Uroleucon formosanum]
MDLLIPKSGKNPFKRSVRQTGAVTRPPRVTTTAARAHHRAWAQCPPESVMETAAPAPHFFHELSRNAPPIEPQTWPKLSPGPNVRSRDLVDTHWKRNSRVFENHPDSFLVSRCRRVGLLWLQPRLGVTR